ncbi:uncharacterized protein LOC102802182 [Saccoglossus kowalevskii]|uniref:P2X purinoceptor 7-like n=1 Tax=Saccoglossus kowalevskii TaxID=10224 RepID=A0ABM0N0L1_SACKO|nr:PREDICTED: P2X purinoceptor 7-like [Saccoglossus kowalevskii]
MALSMADASDTDSSSAESIELSCYFSSFESSEDTEYMILSSTIPRNEIEPYMCEPFCDDSSEGDNSECSDEDHVTDRLENTDWCRCGNCRVMGTDKECVCCRDVVEVTNKMEGMACICITEYPRFNSVCLDVWVLQTANFYFRQHYGDRTEDEPNEQYKYTAYRQFVRWCLGYLGKDIRVVIPSCAVAKIRDEFQSAEYRGFKLPLLD